MRIESLKLAQFRNYSELELSFNPNVNIFWGRNGQGKSNIIEAIYLLLTGKSFRPATSQNLINRECDQKKANLQATVKTSAGLNEISCKINLDQKIKNSINDKPARTKDLLNHFSAVLFCPESLSIIKSGPDQRRQMVDEIITSVLFDGVKRVQDYQKCIKSKSKILKDYSMGKIEQPVLMSVLESLEPSFLLSASKLIMARIHVLKMLLVEANKYIRANLNDNSVDISVDYLISSQSAIDWSQNQVYDALKDRIGKLRVAELKFGRCLVGPQRHDIRFNFNGNDARLTCSQGQQRAVILGFKLAQINHYYDVKGKYPILLLDDVFSEFDFENRGSLLSFLKKIPAQKFITTTELELPEKKVFEEEKKISNFLIEKNKAKAR